MQHFRYLLCLVFIRLNDMPTTHKTLEDLSSVPLPYTEMVSSAPLLYTEMVSSAPSPCTEW